MESERVSAVGQNSGARNFCICTRVNQLTLPFDVLYAVSPVVRDFVKNHPEAGNYMHIDMNLRLSDEYKRFIHGEKVTFDDSNLDVYMFAVALGLESLEEVTYESVKKKKWSASVFESIYNIWKGGCKLGRMAELVNTRIDQAINIPAFWHCKPGFVDEVFSSISQRNIPAAMEYLVERFKRSPNEFRPLLVRTAKKYMNPEVLGILLNVPEFDINEIKDELLELMANQITGPLAEPVILSYEPETSRTKGILSYLEENSQGKVRVTATSVLSDKYRPHNILEDDDSFYCSAIGPVDSIQIDIIGAKIVPDTYLLKSAPSGDTGFAPVQWKLEFSNDGHEWFTASHVVGNRDLCARSHVATFSLEANTYCQPSFSKIRITQIQSGNPRNNRFALARFEVFGSLYDLD